MTRGKCLNGFLRDDTGKGLRSTILYSGHQRGFLQKQMGAIQRPKVRNDVKRVQTGGLHQVLESEGVGNARRM